MASIIASAKVEFLLSSHLLATTSGCTLKALHRHARSFPLNLHKTTRDSQLFPLMRKWYQFSSWSVKQLSNENVRLLPRSNFKLMSVPVERHSPFSSSLLNCCRLNSSLKNGLSLDESATSAMNKLTSYFRSSLKRRIFMWLTYLNLHRNVAFVMHILVMRTRNKDNHPNTRRPDFIETVLISKNNCSTLWRYLNLNYCFESLAKNFPDLPCIV